MTTTAKLLLAATGVLLLATHASGQEAAFTKKGASQAAQKRDSAGCWRLAQNTRLSDEQATQNVLTAYLVGGIIGVLIVSSANEEANKDPKSAFRRQVHDACMAKRGYRKIE
jgi:hypothetical protein